MRSRLGDAASAVHVSNYPAEVQEIYIENALLIRRVGMLQAELEEKNRMISQLREEIDATVLEDTRNRLHYLRLIEQEVEMRTAEVYLLLLRCDRTTSKEWPVSKMLLS